MVALSVAGSGCWQDAGWLWLRITRRGDSKGRLMLEKCLLSKSEWKQFSVDLQEQKDGVISFELWVGESRSPDFLHFVMGWSVDLTQWIHSGATGRWYEIRDPRVRGREMTNNSGYCESTADLKRSAAYVNVGIVTKEPPPYISTFQFVLPHRSLARNGKLRAIRVGQIVHELRTDVLHDLLPLTLYGQSNAKHPRRFIPNRLEDPGDGMAKALVLLQLSCQYANYCVNELDRYSNKLDSRRIKLKDKINRMKHHQNLLKKQRANLQREADVLSCSFDGVQSLLRELDPETLACLQSDDNADLQENTNSKI